MNLDDIRTELGEMACSLLDGERMPAALVEIGGDGSCLAAIHATLNNPNLSYFLVVNTEDPRPPQRPDFPHHIITAQDFNPILIEDALSKQAIDLTQVLYVSLFLGHQRVLELAKASKTQFGILVLEEHSVDESMRKHFAATHPELFAALNPDSQLIKADEWLLRAAQNHLLPRKFFSRHRPHELPFTRFSLNYFEKRPYLIRNPTPSDTDRLDTLEHECWPDALQVPKHDLLKRIERFPSGICVLEQNEVILGVVYAQCILNDEVLRTTNFHQVESFHNPEGTIIQLLAINVPSAQDYVGLGDELMEFMLQLTAVKPGIERVVGVTRCKNYPKYPDLSYQEFIALTDSEGYSIDPVLRFHQQHGGDITTEIANYRPEDAENQGYGVLIRYNLPQLQFRRPTAKAVLNHELVTREKISTTVEATVKAILGKDKAGQYHLQTPLMDMGLESLDLLELRTRLSDALQVDIHPTFFFQHGSCESIINYFIDTMVHKYRDWLYNVEWNELPTPVIPPRPKVAGIWLIFIDDTGWGQELATKLRAYDIAIVLVKMGAYYSVVSPTEFIIRPQVIEDYHSLFAEPSLREGIKGIIYLWGLFNPLPDVPPLATLNSLHALSCSGLLNTVKALGQLKNSSLPKLFLASWSLQKEGDAMSLAQWPMTGLCKAIATEHPDFQLRRITMDRKESNKLTVDYFFMELFAKEQEDQITWRDGKRLGPRLIRIELPESNIPQFDSNATYLLTGGFSGLGLEFIRWYIERGAKHLVILDEGAVPAESELIIQALRNGGVTIRTIEHCEFANSHFMTNTITTIANTMPPIKGLMHLAGIIDDDLVVRMDWERFEPIFNIKVGGSWLLHQLTEHMALDHFILFSSVGSTMGPLWRANRAAANAFLDALSYYRHSHGLPALAINWGPWSQDGNAATTRLPPGMDTLKAEDGMHVLDRILGLPIPEVVVAPINWRDYLQNQIVDKSLFANMASEVGLKKSEIARRFHQASEEDKPDTLKRYVRGLVRRTLKLGPTARLDDDHQLTDLGLDSLSSLELRNLMQYDLGADVPLAFDIIQAHPTVNQLAAALHPLLLNAFTSSSVSVQERQQVEQLHEPIAIIGMSCRFPGGANNPDQYWELLHNGTDAISEVPSSRWDIDAYYDADKDAPGKMYTRFGGFIDHVDLFDPLFFGISPREAEDMDPQQRISLEVTWEALEHAGIAAHTLKGSNTGVFMGICFNDYGQLIRQSGDVSAVDNYYSTGNHYSVAAGRISYILGLEGPAMAIDTACSSSLVSIDNAVKHLHLGQCNLAIAGGVNLILAPESTINFCKNGMLAEDGRCKTFDAKANGYVRSEGCGILILKRLSDAIRDNDRILSVIQATAINQDGAGTGLTVPNQIAQEHVIEDALKQANLKGCDIHYVEAHGTGTSLGDPIEVRALAATYGAQRDSDNPLLIGSAKTNIGHTEAAAGVAGLMKCVLALQHEEIPQHLHFHELNPYIEINAETIRVAQSAEPWRAADRPRYAAISSFGFSGTNSHAILGEAPRTQASDEQKPPYILPLSAKTPEALAAHVQHIKAYLESHPEVNLSDMAYTLQRGRESFTCRHVVIGNSYNELLQMQDHGLHQLPEPLQETVKNWLNGEKTEWGVLYTQEKRHIVTLPTYPFQRKSYWVSSVKDAQKAHGAEDVSDWFYQVQWEPMSLDGKVLGSLKGTWLLLGAGLSDIAGFQDAGSSVVSMTTLDGIELALKTPELEGIVYYAAFDLSCEGLLRLVQSLDLCALNLRLVIVTEANKPLESAPLLGFAKVIGLEHPNWNCLSFEGSINALIDELRSDSNEDEVCFREGLRMVPRLVRGAPQPNHEFSCSEEATYLITGGLGGIGQELLKFLISRGAKHVILTGRRTPDELVRKALASHLQKGIHVEFIQSDVSQQEDVIRLIETIEATHPPLKGIIHAAGSLDVDLISKQTWTRFASTLAPKVQGSWHLHEVTLAHAITLDFFILFSSIASTMGSPGVSSYAAANRYLDALSRYRQQQGLTALTLSWGPWAEVGMVSATARQQERLGYHLISPEQGLLALGLALDSGIHAPIIARFNWASYLNHLSYQSPFYQQMARQKIGLTNDTLVQILLIQDASVREQSVQSFVQTLVQEVLGFKEERPIKSTQGFFDAGMDSITAVELGHRLQACLGDGFKVSMTVAFDYPTIERLSSYVLSLVGGVQLTQASRSLVYHSEPIAIIGMACRFPGEADSPEIFWDNLMTGVDGTKEVPTVRWDIQSYYDPDPDVLGKMNTRRGGFIDDIDRFDADFFGISPREAKFIDPQQRLLLELSYEALERAGIAPQSLSGSDTGVFIGISFNDYSNLIIQSKQKELLGPYFATGMALNAASGRIAYFFGFQGPCETIDTACSSSLVSAHNACVNLQTGACDLALAGGVNLTLMPDITAALSSAKMLAPDGHCKTFDKGADGYVRGEGCGIIVLKRLSDALRDNDPILAVIKGSAVSQDGASSGLMVPNGLAQAALMQTALKAADVMPNDVNYLEAHGTGTQLGDPIELGGITKVYGVGRQDLLMLGAVKSNIGHLESASGVAGIIKTVLALQHRVIPPNLHFHEVNPKIDLKAIPAQVVDVVTPWVLSGQPVRTAGISAFGFTGTIAHMIVQEAPTDVSEDKKSLAIPLHLLTFSAKSEVALRDILNHYQSYAGSLSDLAYTLNTGRDVFDFRVALIVMSIDDLHQQLSDNHFLIQRTGQEEAVNCEFIHADSTAGPQDTKARRFVIHSDTDWESLWKEVSTLYLNGARIDWTTFYSGYDVKKQILPTYAFQRQRHWVDELKVMPEPDWRDVTLHPILGRQIISEQIKELLFETHVTATWPDFLPHHKIYDYVVIPGAAYLSAALSLLERLNEGKGCVQGIEFLQPVVLPQGSRRCLQTLLKPDDVGYEFKVVSIDEGELYKLDPAWTVHAQGRLNFKYEFPQAQAVDLDAIKRRCQQHITKKELYPKVRELGLQLEQHLQWIEEIDVGADELLAKMRAPEGINETQGYVLYPGFIDSCFQTQIVRSVAFEGRDVIAIPLAIGQFWIYPHTGHPAWIYFTKRHEAGNVLSDIALLNEQGDVIGGLLGYRDREAPREALERAIIQKEDVSDYFYTTSWDDVALLPDMPLRPCKRIIISPQTEYARALISRMNPSSETLIKSFDALVEEQINLSVFEQIVVMVGLEPLDLGDIKCIIQAQEQGIKPFVALIQSLIRDSEGIQPPQIVLVTAGVQGIDQETVQYPYAGLNGLLKVLMVEHTDIPFLHVDLEWPAEPLEACQALRCELNQPVNKESLIAYRNGRRLVARVIRACESMKRSGELLYPMTPDYQLSVPIKGALDQLVIKPLSLKNNLGEDDVEVIIKATGVNFRDVLTVLNLYPGDPGPLGLEGAGIVSRVGSGVTEFKAGDEVFGYMRGSYSTHAVMNRHWIIKKPVFIGFSEAASIPAIYLTAYQGLVILGHLKAGEKILIHAGAGGVGQAAIQIALHLGAIVFATAGDERKRALLKQQGVPYVMDSRSLSYGEAIHTITEGSGVDMVLNSLSGEGFIQTTINQCAQGARFLEIGKRDIWTVQQMKQARPDIDYHTIAIDEIAEDDPAQIQNILQALKPLFESKSIKVVPITAFPIHKAIDAFHFMRTAQHIGKIVITYPEPHRAIDKLSAQATYLITGGLGGVGLALAKWLAEKGAGIIVLSSRSKPTEQMSKAIAAIDGRIEVITTDISQGEDVRALLARIHTEESPLKGVFHLAGVIDDAPFTKQDWEGFTRVLGPKVYGSFYLHHYTEALHIELDYFVLFSSVASTFGNAGQSNYAAANGFMDGLALYRRSQGLPAQSRAWGPWGEVGMAAQLTGTHGKQGWYPFSVTQGMNALAESLQYPQANLSIIHVGWPTYLAYLPKPLSWLHAFQGTQVVEKDLITELEQTPVEERMLVIEGYVSQMIRSVLGLNAFQVIDDQKGLFDMGLDSLMAIELKNRLQAGLGKGVVIASTTLFDYPSLSKLTQYIALQLDVDVSAKVMPMRMSQPLEADLEERIKKETSQLSFDEVLKQLGEKS